MGNVFHPNHYTECSLECIEVMKIAFGKKATYDFCKMNAFKYLWRYKNKNGGEDLEKAKNYLGMAEELRRDMFPKADDEQFLDLKALIKKIEQQ